MKKTYKKPHMQIVDPGQFSCEQLAKISKISEVFLPISMSEENKEHNMANTDCEI